MGLDRTMNWLKGSASQNHLKILYYFLSMLNSRLSKMAHVRRFVNHSLIVLQQSLKMYHNNVVLKFFTKKYLRILKIIFFCHSLPPSSPSLSCRHLHLPTSPNWLNHQTNKHISLSWSRHNQKNKKKTILIS